MSHDRDGADGERDLAGYGPEPPEAAWPEGARLAVSLVVNLEEGAELTPRDGDERREPRGEFDYGVPPEERDVLHETLYEYGSRAGAWRLLRLLDDAGAVATVFACGRAVERVPELVAAMVDRGFDFAGHGYRWESHHGMTEAQERESIGRTLEAIASATGRSAEGWFTRPPPSVRTRRLLVEAGLSWDSDSYADDLPYYTPVAGRSHLVLPYSVDVNDIRFWNGTVHTARDWFSYARDAFDQLYEEGASRPRMLSVGLHPRIIGRPGRARGLAWFLEHVRAHRGVWIATRGEIARHWRQANPPAAP